MARWSVEMRDGFLDQIPSSLETRFNEHKKNGAIALFLAEGGIARNEPDEELPLPIFTSSSQCQSVGHMGHALSWVFERFECEINQDCGWNYIKISFMNMNSTRHPEGECGGTALGLPSAPEQSSELTLQLVAKALAMFGRYVRGSVDASSNFPCDWVTMALTKDPDFINS